MMKFLCYLFLFGVYLGFIPSTSSFAPVKHRVLTTDIPLFLSSEDQQAPEHASLLVSDDAALDRRNFFASSLIAAGTWLGATGSSEANLLEPPGALKFTASPVNKRFGVKVQDAERAGYSTSFVTYLTRFLLNFDPDCQRYWFTGLQFPSNAKAAQIEDLRVQQFAALAASVEIGLQSYTGDGKNGPKRLLADLLDRYCPNEPDNSADSSKRRRREIREARRQLALLFALLDNDIQPVSDITKLLAALDNATLDRVEFNASTPLLQGGYAKDNLPTFSLPCPQAGPEFTPASVEPSKIRPTGSLLGAKIIDGGSGYATRSKDGPIVTVTPPRAEFGTAAQFAVKVGKSGNNKGSITEISMLNPGSGYQEGEEVLITVAFASDNNETDRIEATIEAVLEYKVTALKIAQGGSGYAAERPVRVYVGPPDSPVRNESSTDLRARVEKGELQVAGMAFPKAEFTSFASYRKSDDEKNLEDLEKQFEKNNKMDLLLRGASSSGNDDGLPALPLWTGSSKSSELLRLLPAGIGVEYDLQMQRYKLGLDATIADEYPVLSSFRNGKPFNPDFGPRGRSPVERDREISLDTLLRFSASGAVCAAGVNLALTPLDLVKTKVQVDGKRYPNVVSAFGTVFREEGLSTFYTGWLPTLTGNFILGGLLYSITEVIRRYLSDFAGADAGTYEVPIILLAAGVASAVGAAINCPFEAVRIRSVAQPDFAPDAVGVLNRMLEEEGWGSLLNAIPVFLAKNVPYSAAKFTIFDLSTEKLYNAFPVATEDLKLSFVVTLVSGVLGGIGAACVSNPADTIISEMKKTKGDVSPQTAAAAIIERGGVSDLFTGLPLRMVFYSLVASLQFVVYDGVRFALGIGPDDLKLYLDVLGGALRESGIA